MITALQEAVRATYGRITHPMYLRDQFGVWVTCPHCEQSCTGSYVGFYCCTRCQRVVA